MVRRLVMARQDIARSFMSHTAGHLFRWLDIPEVKEILERNILFSLTQKGRMRISYEFVDIEKADNFCSMRLCFVRVTLLRLKCNVITFAFFTNEAIVFY